VFTHSEWSNVVFPGESGWCQNDSRVWDSTRLGSCLLSVHREVRRDATRAVPHLAGTENVFCALSVVVSETSWGSRKVSPNSTPSSRWEFETAFATLIGK
jgi:hypothetical protein